MSHPQPEPAGDGVDSSRLRASPNPDVVILNSQPHSYSGDPERHMRGFIPTGMRNRNLSRQHEEQESDSDSESSDSENGVHPALRDPNAARRGSSSRLPEGAGLRNRRPTQSYSNPAGVASRSNEDRLAAMTIGGGQSPGRFAAQLTASPPTSSHASSPSGFNRDDGPFIPPSNHGPSVDSAYISLPSKKSFSMSRQDERESQFSRSPNMRPAGISSDSHVGASTSHRASTFPVSLPGLPRDNHEDRPRPPSEIPANVYNNAPAPRRSSTMPNSSSNRPRDLKDGDDSNLGLHPMFMSSASGCRSLLNHHLSSTHHSSRCK